MQTKTVTATTAAELDAEIAAVLKDEPLEPDEVHFSTTAYVIKGGTTARVRYTALLVWAEPLTESFVRSIIGGGAPSMEDVQAGVDRAKEVADKWNNLDPPSHITADAAAEIASEAIAAATGA